MEFPIPDLMDNEKSAAWLLEHFHTDELMDKAIRHHTR
jgi:hypothetical protein